MARNVTRRPTKRRPEPRWSDPPSFHPVVTGIAVFLAVAMPFVVYALTRPSGTDDHLLALGVGIGVIAGLIVGLLLDGPFRGRE